MKLNKQNLKKALCYLEEKAEKYGDPSKALMWASLGISVWMLPTMFTSVVASLPTICFMIAGWHSSKHTVKKLLK